MYLLSALPAVLQVYSIYYSRNMRISPPHRVYEAHESYLAYGCPQPRTVVVEPFYALIIVRTVVHPRWAIVVTSLVVLAGDLLSIHTLHHPTAQQVLAKSATLQQQLF